MTVLRFEKELLGYDRDDITENDVKAAILGGWDRVGDLIHLKFRSWDEYKQIFTQWPVLDRLRLHGFQPPVLRSFDGQQFIDNPASKVTEAHFAHPRGQRELHNLELAKLRSMKKV